MERKALGSWLLAVIYGILIEMAKGRPKGGGVGGLSGLGLNLTLTDSRTYQVTPL